MLIWVHVYTNDKCKQKCMDLCFYLNLEMYTRSEEQQVAGSYRLRRQLWWFRDGWGGDYIVVMVNMCISCISSECI